MTFTTKLLAAQQTNNSWVCVGLDPVMERMPEAVRDDESPFLAFGRAIVKATADVASAYKPNLGFWLAEGTAGLSALQQLIAEIPKDIPVILDAKFNDIGNSAKAYARTAFEALKADVVTSNPYLGRDSAQSFLEYADHGIFLLARTSNASAPDLQDQMVEGHPLYEKVAQLATGWGAEFPGTCGLVVGATYPEELARLRQIAPELPFLIPGIGAQGGNLEAAVTHGPTSAGIGPVINSSRGIIYASPGSDYAEAARAAAIELRDRINRIQEGAK
jgi:orotidine-5'-phosphate decarboxylase